MHRYLPNALASSPPPRLTSASERPCGPGSVSLMAPSLAMSWSLSSLIKASSSITFPCHPNQRHKPSDHRVKLPKSSQISPYGGTQPPALHTAPKLDYPLLHRPDTKRGKTSPQLLECEHPWPGPRPGRRPAAAAPPPGPPAWSANATLSAHASTLGFDGGQPLPSYGSSPLLTHRLCMQHQVIWWVRPAQSSSLSAVTARHLYAEANHLGVHF
jgi:hypothetical protein